METVKLNPRQVINSETNAIEVQGTAILKSLGEKVFQNNPQDGNPKNFRLGDIVYTHNGVTEVKSAQVFEKTYAGNPEKGTEPVKIGEAVAINVSADETNTYFRVIGNGAGLDSKDTFASLLGSAKPVSQTTKETADPAGAPAG